MDDSMSPKQIKQMIAMLKQMLPEDNDEEPVKEKPKPIRTVDRKPRQTENKFDQMLDAISKYETDLYDTNNIDKDIEIGTNYIYTAEGDDTTKKHTLCSDLGFNYDTHATKSNGDKISESDCRFLCNLKLPKICNNYCIQECKNTDN